MLSDRIAEGFAEDKAIIEAQQVIVSENPDIAMTPIHFDNALARGRKMLATALREESELRLAQA